MKEKKKKKKNKKNKKQSSDSSDSEDEEKKKEKLKKVNVWFWLKVFGVLYLRPNSAAHMSTQALEAEDRRVKHIDALMQIDERKRPYHSLQEVKAPTEEEIEAFHMKRCRPDDPMASFLGQ